ncbi:MAG: 3-hydroxyacyl-CoA dehydrogenase NAD-binding domain-containing protein [Proteobacteria bacterium]|nr:3-hydroxyacyl-CoA dehydrogenase NAD-binding domain-containing protein [Pseudomonadota bacterium]
MTRQINSVAVCGSGTMGAGIAALCANAGLPVLFLDMPAREGERNGVVAAAVENMQGGRQPMLKDAAALARITIGNFDDDMAKIADCDWIVEVIIEDLAIKRSFFAKLEAARAEGSIVTTNTSGIMLRAITAGLPERLCRDIAVTHFFNPVLVMKLVELIPGAQTDRDVLDTLAALLEGALGKGVVWAKDTVNFIANRIGCFWLLAGLNEAQAAFDAGCSIEDVDAALSQPLGVPPTGLYGLLDLVGLDVIGLVAENLRQNLSTGDAGLAYAEIPEAVQGMLDRGQIGRKAGGGFYRMGKTPDGERLKETFDLTTGAWRDSAMVELADGLQSPAGLMFDEGRLGRLAWAVMGGTLIYAADLIPQISEDVVNIDRAMRWGFNWRQGPFEMLDSLGPDRVMARLEAEGRPLPRMLQVLRDAGAGGFYRNDGAEFLGLDGAWHPVP